MAWRWIYLLLFHVTTGLDPVVHPGDGLPGQARQ
jgi:hypothetical protein